MWSPLCVNQPSDMANKAGVASGYLFCYTCHYMDWNYHWTGLRVLECQSLLFTVSLLASVDCHDPL